MKERLLLIEGKLEMTTGETKGTKITIIVPKVKKPAITIIVTPNSEPFTIANEKKATA